MVEPIRYISVNSNHTFDYNYQKASLLTLLDALRKNDNTSAKLKKMLIEKARETLGLKYLPDSERVIPFFHCQEGEFHITFLYNSIATSTPWEMIIANNFGELIPLFKEIYDLLKMPIFNSSSATIGNYSVFHNQNALSYYSNNTTGHLPISYGEYDHANDTGCEDTTNEEELSINESNHKTLTRKNTNKKDTATTVNNHLIAIKKSLTKKGRKNSLVTESIQMSSSMPNLDNKIFTHRYATRHRKNNSILTAN